MNQAALTSLEVPIRVRYGETDKMGIVHHSNYLRYVEVARMELFDRLGCPYTEIESGDAFLVVTRASCTYLSPSTFDDLLHVHIALTRWSKFRLLFRFSIRKENHLVARGETALAAVSRMGAPGSLPENLLERLKEIHAPTR